MVQINKHGFASDNSAGVHPEILKAMAEINTGHALAYGNDIFTERAVNKFKEHFGKEIDVYFVYSGTAANVLSLKASTQPHNAVICADTSHINLYECGAPERFTGCKLLQVKSIAGKLTVEQIKRHLNGIGDDHQSQPKVISITQATELGTVYTQKEIKDITDFAHKHNMFVHMDGARIANAAASLNLSLKEITKDVGIDILSFGGIKNGMMYGEAIVFFNKTLSNDFKYTHMQGMQLASKMRFIAIQFETLLTDDLWLKNAKHANEMAKLLEKELKDVPKIKITQKVETNGVFAIIPKEHIQSLQKEYFFYVWNEETSEVRFMTAFDTKEEDIKYFVKMMKEIVK